MSSDLFGFDNSFLNETFSQDRLFFETWQDFHGINESSSLSELGDADYYSVFELKSEECRLSLCRFSTFSCYGSSVSLSPHDQTAANFYSHNNYQNKESFSCKPQFDCAPEWKNRYLPSPETSSFSSGEMRSICSNGDLHKVKASMQRSSMEEADLQVGRYSAAERKVRIDRYRAKRARRNFNKTIKYACRKTLADGRQRVHGRFARNDEVGEILKASLFQRCEDEDGFWIDGFTEKMTKGLCN